MEPNTTRPSLSAVVQGREVSFGLCDGDPQMQGREGSIEGSIRIPGYRPDNRRSAPQLLRGGERLKSAFTACPRDRP